MTTRTLSLAFVLVAAFGCSRSPSTQSPAAPTTTPSIAAKTFDSTAIVTPATAEVAGSVDERALLSTRVPGDYVVYKFSGTFRKTPATLIERVVSDDGGLYVIDYTLIEGPKKKTLRVQLNDAAGAQVHVLEVASIEGGAEHAATTADFDAMMARTVLAVDANEATTNEEEVVVEVSGRTLACARTSYAVMVKGKRATMTLTESRSFAWGDVGGSIVAEDGTVLYRAELVEIGKGSDGESVAAAQ